MEPQLNVVDVRRYSRDIRAVRMTEQSHSLNLSPTASVKRLRSSSGVVRHRRRPRFTAIKQYRVVPNAQPFTQKTP